MVYNHNDHIQDPCATIPGLYTVRLFSTVANPCGRYHTEKQMEIEKKLTDLTLDDATKLLITLLRNPDHGRFPEYGYDFYLPNLMRTYFASSLKISNTGPKMDDALLKYSPQFYAAAWDLCRRGIIRPGINSFRAQETSEGSAGNGYSITPFGKSWLKEKNGDDFVPTEPDRFAQMLEPFREKFGPSYHQRGQEAIRCYNAHAYLASCTMCGAAAESALLTAAIKKTNDENMVLKMYRSQSGRIKIEKLLIGEETKHLERKFSELHTLLKYWRDEAAHGGKSNIGENEAFTALALLLRFSMFLEEIFLN